MSIVLVIAKLMKLVLRCTLLWMQIILKLRSCCWRTARMLQYAMCRVERRWKGRLKRAGTISGCISTRLAGTASREPERTYSTDSLRKISLSSRALIKSLCGLSLRVQLREEPGCIWESLKVGEETVVSKEAKLFDSQFCSTMHKKWI